MSDVGMNPDLPTNQPSMTAYLSSAIDDMNNQGIHLVVPESLKTSVEICYHGKPNAIAFREFFDDEISTKRANYRKT